MPTTVSPVKLTNDRLRATDFADLVSAYNALHTCNDALPGGWIVDRNGVGHWIVMRAIGHLRIYA